MGGSTAASRCPGRLRHGGIAATLGARPPGRARRAIRRGEAAVLVAAGSAHPVARAQVAALVADGALGVVVPVDVARARDRNLDATVVLAAAALSCRPVRRPRVPPSLAPGARVTAPRTADDRGAPARGRRA